MIELTRSHFFGRGLHRECYEHPNDSSLCIKVVVAGNLQESQREQKYYKLLKKRGTPWEVLPEFHGVVETNLGSGAVFDLIRDYDGSISKTLRHYLSSPETPPPLHSEIANAINAFGNSLYQLKLITMTLSPKNIVFKKLSPSGNSLVIIDNIGNSDFIPITNHIDFLAQKKILRRLTRFHSSVLKMSQHKPELHTVLKAELKTP